MNEVESQRHQILMYMLDGGRITPMEALKKFRCMRLGARIYEIKKRGLPVEDRFVTVVSASGKKRVKQYWIDEENLPSWMR